MSDGLDVISGLAGSDGKVGRQGPWTTTGNSHQYNTNTNDDSYLAGCSIEFPGPDEIYGSYNTITNGNEAAIRHQVTARPAQFCYSEVPIPLSDMRRQPVATADSGFVMSDNTMQCPTGSEPVHNAEDCLTYVAGKVTATNDASERYYSSSSRPDGCLYYLSSPGSAYPSLFYNDYHHLSGKYPDLSTRVSASNQENYRVVCRLLAPLAPTAAPTLAPTVAPTPPTVPSSHYYPEFPSDPAVLFEAGSSGCNSRAWLRHLTEPECAAIVGSGELDRISGLASTVGPGRWDTSEVGLGNYDLNVAGNVWNLPGCSFHETDGSDDNFDWQMFSSEQPRLRMIYNNIDPTTQTVNWFAQDTRRLQICYSGVPVPLSEMRRQPASSASTSFVLADATMECPQGAEPVTCVLNLSRRGTCDYNYKRGLGPSNLSLSRSQLQSSLAKPELLDDLCCANLVRIWPCLCLKPELLN